MNHHDDHDGHDGRHEDDVSGVPGLHEGLHRLSAAARPTPQAGPRVHAGVRRARRRRTTATLVGTAGLVAAVVVGGQLVGGAGGVRPQPAAPTEGSAGPAAFRCPTEVEPIARRPIPDLAEQRAVLADLRRLSAIWVRAARATPVGIVALVDDGDGNRTVSPSIRDRLARLGVVHVFAWDRVLEGQVSTGMQVEMAIGQVLDDARTDLRRAYRGVPGYAGERLDHRGATVVLQWEAPVPTEVEALAGVRLDGVEVVVEPVAYSRAELDRARERFASVADPDQPWSLVHACADGSGLVVGVAPPVADRGALQRDLAAGLGVPVMVVAKEPARVVSGALTPLSGG